MHMMMEKGGISMVEANLPPGFRFHPRDDELVCDYLMTRTHVRTRHPPVLFIQVDLNKCEPWDIPQTACVGGKEWYFYSLRDRKYATGSRTNRATASGYWKATGKDRTVQRKGRSVGMRKTLVFYKGRAPKGRKTCWVMHEFRLQPSFPPPMEDWVLCRVFYKNGEGVGKGSIQTCSGSDGAAVSVSLPPLMDSYITFGLSDHQPHQHSSFLTDDDPIITQQVPCFSNLPDLTALFSEPKPPSPSKNPHPLFTGPAPMTAAATGLDSCCDDQMVLGALLNQLTKMEGNLNAQESHSFGEGSSESLLTEVCIPSTAWNY